MILKKGFLLFAFGCLFCSCDVFGYTIVNGTVKSAWGASEAGKYTTGGAGDPLAKNESLQLINLYWKLANDDQREMVMKMLRALNGME